MTDAEALKEFVLQELGTNEVIIRADPDKLQEILIPVKINDTIELKHFGQIHTKSLWIHHDSYALRAIYLKKENTIIVGYPTGRIFARIEINGDIEMIYVGGEIFIFEGKIDSVKIKYIFEDPPKVAKNPDI